MSFSCSRFWRLSRNRRRIHPGRNLQNAADAAALAGAQSLTGLSASQALAVTAATDYRDKNISDTTFFTASVQNNYTEVHVTVKKKAATAFAGWMSFGEPEVSGEGHSTNCRTLIAGSWRRTPGDRPVDI